MKIFGINFTTKKELKKENERLKLDVESATKINEEVIGYNEEIGVALEEMKKAFPLTIGDIVYDLQLRGENGRYTRAKASKSHSVINEVVVDKKNYFKLVDRLDYDVFISKEAAESYLDEICVK